MGPGAARRTARTDPHNITEAVPLEPLDDCGKGDRIDR